MITNPKLKPIRGYVEIEYNGRRMYRNVKTGEIVEPGAVIPNREDSTTEIINTLLGVSDNE